MDYEDEDETGSTTGDAFESASSMLPREPRGIGVASAWIIQTSGSCRRWATCLFGLRLAREPLLPSQCLITQFVMHQGGVCFHRCAGTR